MVNRVIEYYIRCDKCHDTLDHAYDSTLIAHRGHTIKEDTMDNIIEVAIDRKWSVNGNSCICPNCLIGIIGGTKI